MATTHVRSEFLKWFAKSPIGTFLRAFAATLLALAIADWSSAASVSFANWQSWVLAALAAAIPVIIRALNTADTVYGYKPSAP